MKTKRGMDKMTETLSCEDYDVPPVAIPLEDLLGFLEEDDWVHKHYAYLWKKEDLEKYKDEVYELLVNGYTNKGGMLGIGSADQLVAETDHWKVWIRKDKITAAFCYSRKRGGWKTCYGSCLMTDEGMRDLFKMMKDDMEQLGRKVWLEVSDENEHVYIGKLPVPAIPAGVAQMAMRKKKFEKIDDDGYHYWRRIDGELGRKIMIGVYDEKMLQALTSE